MTTTTALTEEGTSRSIQAGGMKIHYHEAGKGEPVIFLHSYNVGTTAWINFHKNLGPLSEHFRCIAMDLPNFGGTDSVTIDSYMVRPRAVLALMDALNIRRAHLVGNSIGGTSALSFSISFPERVNKLVVGACHASRGGNPYLIANRPPEAGRVNREFSQNPTLENMRRSMRVHLDNEALVTDELVEYMYQSVMSHPEHAEAARRSPNPPHDNFPDLPNLKVPTLIIHGRYDRMVPCEVGLAIMNYIPNSRLVVFNHCGHWPPYEHPEEYNSQVLNFLKMG